MNNEFVEIPSVIEVYESPALVGVGDFAEAPWGGQAGVSRPSGCASPCVDPAGHAVVPVA